MSRDAGPGDPLVAWYDAWRDQQSGRRDAEAADRASMEREVRWMAYVLVGWALAAAAAGIAAIAILSRL